jgi:hypothetical protein
MREPMGVKQICLEVGISEHRSDNLMPYIRALKKVGHVYVSGWSQRRRPIYAWQSQAWENEDALRPEPKLPPRPQKHTVAREYARQVVSSVFALGAQ